MNTPLYLIRVLARGLKAGSNDSRVVNVCLQHLHGAQRLCNVYD